MENQPMRVTIFEGHRNEYEPITKIIASRFQGNNGFKVDLESGCLCEHPPVLQADAVIVHPHHYKTKEDEQLEKRCLQGCSESFGMNPKTHFYVLVGARKKEREKIIRTRPNITLLSTEELAVLYNWPEKLLSGYQNH